MFHAHCVVKETTHVNKILAATGTGSCSLIYSKPERKYNYNSICNKSLTIETLDYHTVQHLTVLSNNIIPMSVMMNSPNGTLSSKFLHSFFT
jgi:hypothetical protein